MNEDEPEIVFKGEIKINLSDMLRLSLISIVVLTLMSLNVQAQYSNTPDTISSNQGEIVIHPILHGTIVFEWNDKTIFVDPYGGADRFEKFNNPDLIMITHAHGDHLNPETLDGLNTENAAFIVPQSVADELSEKYQDQLMILANDELMTMDELNLTILAMPMYNLPEETARHAKGWGNGYILTMGDKNVYISGDTEDIPEMRGLQDIDAAFICMNLPYTMDVKQAADAVLDFEPDIVYPYHHRGQDIEEFKALINVEERSIEVRLKDWYTEM